jgi:O-antigen/teichoic acid export membrane protein
MASQSTHNDAIQKLLDRLPKSIASRLQPALTLFSGRGAQQGYLAGIDQGLISLTNFIAAIILARVVDPTEFGVYAVFGSVMKAVEFKGFVTGNGILQILLALLSACGAAAGGWVLTLMGNDTAGPALYTLWFAFLFWQLQEYIRRVFYARSDILQAVINTLLSSLIRLGLLVFWWWRGGLTKGSSGMDAIAWGALGAFILSLWQARGYWSSGNIHLRTILKQNWDYGRWVLGASIANWVATEVYPIMAAGLISFAAAGAYRALQNLVAPVHVLLRASDTFFTPRAARLFSQGGYPGLTRALRLIYLISGLPILVLLITASFFPVPLLELLYGQTYLPYKDGLYLMAIYYGLLAAYWPLQSAFKAIQRTKPIFLANMIAILTMFTLGVWAIQRWNVYGAIAGQALNALIISVILWGIWLKRE